MAYNRGMPDRDDAPRRSPPRAATEPARPCCAVCGVELIAADATDATDALCAVHRRHRHLVPRPSAALPQRFAHEVRLLRRPAPPAPAPRVGRARTEPL